jgi:hypothetical protein
MLVKDSKRKYTRSQIEEAVKNSTSVVGVLRQLGVQYRSGTSWRMIKSYLVEFGLDTSHFTRTNTGKVSPKKRPPSVVLTFDPNRTYRVKGFILRRVLFEVGVPCRCSGCGLGPEWNGKKLQLVVDHENGDWRDCRRENLRLLCPNCHSQTETFNNRKSYATVSCKRCGSKFESRVKLDGTTATEFCSTRCGGSTAQQKVKGLWPDPVELRRMVWDSTVEKVAKHIGVSGCAVKKRCKRLGIGTPPRGYWSKMRGNSSGGEHTMTPC